MNWHQLFSPQQNKIFKYNNNNTNEKSQISGSKNKSSLKQIRNSLIQRLSFNQKENINDQFDFNERKADQDSFSKFIFQEIQTIESPQQLQKSSNMKNLTDNLKQLCKISKKQLQCQKHLLRTLQESQILKKGNKKNKQQKNFKSKSTTVSKKCSRKIINQEKINTKIKQFQKLKKQLRLMMRQKSKEKSQQKAVKKSKTVVTLR